MINESGDPSFFIVAGVHKAGTTTLYNYFRKHPDFFSPYRKELHFFTPFIYGNEVEELQKYYSLFEKRGNERFLLDISPSYLYDDKLIPKQLSNLKAPVKCLVILRDPTDRFVSFYKQGIKTGNILKDISLREYYERSKEEFEKYVETGQKRDDFFNRGLREGCYSLYIENWMETLNDNFKIVFFDDLVSKPLDLFSDIFQWIGVEYSNITDNLNQENKSFKPRFQWLSKWVTSFYKENEKFFRKNRLLTVWFKNIYKYINQTEYTENSIKSEKMIRDFYTPFNEKLIDLLPNYKSIISNWN